MWEPSMKRIPDPGGVRGSQFGCGQGYAPPYAKQQTDQRKKQQPTSRTILLNCPLRGVRPLPQGYFNKTCPGASIWEIDNPTYQRPPKKAMFLEPWREISSHCDTIFSFIRNT
jgi:hypothetical protein